MDAGPNNPGPFRGRRSNFPDRNPNRNRNKWRDRSASHSESNNSRSDTNNEQQNRQGQQWVIPQRGRPGNRDEQNAPRPIGFNKTKFIGFKALMEMSESDVKDIILKVNEKRNAFISFLENSIERQDLFVLIIKILAKCCQSSFDELKMKLLLDICNTNFIKNLIIYLMNLPYDTSKTTNSFYWNDQTEFWTNFIIFCEWFVQIAPSMALKYCRSLIEATSSSCLSGLNEKHGYVISEELAERLSEARKRLNLFEKMSQSDPKCLEIRAQKEHYEPPPDDFRQLSIIPTRDDLLLTRPFVRSNIVDGNYRDIEHYLDVQFRLLREDCFGPLRDGINQYVNDPKRKKYDHIRIFHDVKFVMPYVSPTKIGSVVQINTKINKVMTRVNWEHSKRFIFGSLVLFTQDECRSFLVGTILDRNPQELRKGRVPVTLIGYTYDQELYNNNVSYTMIESEVYFEPYYHVLKVLSNPQFALELPMQEYIVKVEPKSKPPAYLGDNPTYFYYRDDPVPNNADGGPSVDLDSPVLTDDELLTEDKNSDMSLLRPMNLKVERSIFHGLNHIKCENGIKFKVLDNDNWPSQTDLGFDSSQFDAYKLALTHEFAVIQGPPGTGKTYLGIKIAKTLLHNLTRDGCCMMVICYTNHALDQFLEAILEITPSVVRIGGQSRNKKMEEINVNRLRRQYESCNVNKLFLNERFGLKCLVADLKCEQMNLEVLTNGVISYDYIRNEVGEIEMLATYYREIGITHVDPLVEWLFEYNVNDYQVSIENCLAQDEVCNLDNLAHDEQRLRTEITDEDIFDDDNDVNKSKLFRASFLLSNIKLKTRDLIKKYKETNRSDFNLKSAIQKMTSVALFFEDMRANKNRPVRIRITQATPFHRIRVADRWALYFNWIEPKVDKVKEKILELQDRLTPAVEAFEEARMMVDLQVLRGSKVVGMTTSGAARMRKLIKAVAPPIVIVEEAAEVLEQHIVTSLTPSCQHLILIGDHQQLRPSASHMKLARHYNIEVSLFERMIKNGIHSRRLGVQHRMRAEIAALISPHIYPNLENHVSVETFPHVMGMDKDVYFFTHSNEEEEIMDNSSKSNQKEGDIVLGLANYLMQQGYHSDDVTILAAYSGQMFYMKKQRDKYPHLQNVKITVVDNYQGEESKIILLSLVRNNKENKIGFLGTENRICVALSRAKEGFYIFGNINMLKSKSELWMKIATTLESQNALGTIINLKCENHPKSITAISKEEDFLKSPEGGCLLKCDYDFACGHKCTLLCHGYDRSHDGPYTRCKQNCEKILCELNHKCPKLCWEECGPCSVLVRKTLPCDHEMVVKCHKDPEDPSVHCLTMTTVLHPDCNHEVEKMCFENINKVKCRRPCEFRVPTCGHVCLRTCHVTHDPQHEQYKCKKVCPKAKKGCQADLVDNRGDHQCKKLCHEECDPCVVIVTKKRSKCTHKVETACSKNADETKCFMRCNRKLSCDHFCKKLCHEECGGCTQMVDKEIPGCKHKLKVACSVGVTRELCTKKCERTLSCGHKCVKLCGEPCDQSVCKELSTKRLMSPCGHVVSIPCGMLSIVEKNEVSEKDLVSWCVEPCNTTLACDHVCTGTCSKCYQGRIHIACRQPCNRPNICGHLCEEPCNQICPPCNKQCEVRCQHSRCNLKCGVPCTPCRERCARGCKHGRCRRACGLPCAVPACARACPRRLPCGHPCRGLCGELCPDVCRQCRPDHFPVDFLGDPFPDDAKFIQLQDCKHVLEVEDMDTLMLGNTESISIRTCPFCRTPIINTNRYKDVVNNTFKNDINPIKRKIYGNQGDVTRKLEALFKKQHTDESYKIFANANNKVWNNKFETLITEMKKASYPSLVELEMFSAYLEILEMVKDCVINNYASRNSLMSRIRDIRYRAIKLDEDVHKQINFICNVLTFNRNYAKGRPRLTLKVSQQQQKDIGNEIKRLNAIVQYTNITNNDSYMSSQSELVAKANKDARALVFSYSVFNEDACLEVLQNLQKAVNISGVVTKQERDLIVKAIGLKAGHWFKCPNGHFYCIADCGGAMVESVCIECKAKVGGTSHRLLPTNSHAPELDGSAFPAWSERNNMINYRF